MLEELETKINELSPKITDRFNHAMGWNPQPTEFKRGFHAFAHTVYNLDIWRKMADSRLGEPDAKVKALLPLYFKTEKNEFESALVDTIRSLPNENNMEQFKGFINKLAIEIIHANLERKAYSAMIATSENE